MHVVDERPLADVSELLRRQVEPRRDAEAVVRLERRVLTRGQELRRDAERALARLARRSRSLGVDDVQLGRQRGCAEGEREPAASLVVVEAVENAACELALTDEHALDREPSSRLVETCLVRPGAAVDVVLDDVAVVLDVRDPRELTRAIVAQPVDRHRLDLSRLREIEVAGCTGVLEEARCEEEPLRARRAVRRMEARGRVLDAFSALFDRRAVENSTAVAIRLVDDAVAGRVEVGEECA